MLRVENLTKQYGDFTAVSNANFSAGEGKLFGLLGPNGAGKSTTISCISGLMSPTSGRISVGGFDIVKDGKKAKSTLGVVPQELALYEDLVVAGESVAISSVSSPLTDSPHWAAVGGQSR